MAEHQSRRRRYFPFKGTASQNSRKSKKGDALVLRSRKDPDAPNPENHNDPDAPISETQDDLDGPALETQDGPDAPKKWEDATAGFLAQLPISEGSWVKIRVDTQLSTLEHIINAFELLTLRPSSICSPIPHAKSILTTSDTIVAYQDLRKTLRQHANLLAQLDKYSDLIWYCIWRVARQVARSVEDVDKFVATVLPERDQSSTYGMRLRTAAGLAARIIEQLENELGYLGSFLCLLCCPPMETFRIWTDWVETLGYIVKQVQLKYKDILESIVEWVPNDTLVSFSPVFIVASIGPWSLSTVNKALGTNLSGDGYNQRVKDLQKAKERLKGTSPLCSKWFGVPLGSYGGEKRVGRNMVAWARLGGQLALLIMYVSYINKQAARGYRQAAA
ncbi:hypothetical protein B0J13DRAFT_652992 [Dactylonectria estremocensis]|uniref:Uncharacterized protein n=1 Tax=Dactylonectria estremocensis TaxID=1079267 RepID=A0A9P9DDA7_9HYPO|nr:hypothetical protein B0J13DRAFT_652992 [Dactylonectria estremocensis]